MEERKIINIKINGVISTLKDESDFMDDFIE